ncbi:MAG: metallopeptidase family protein [Candidatus Kerfeldbacteria bacterium]|nr:metallopeptidase family protein [Candidatus Kerfeldbacteria bacterium]
MSNVVFVVEDHVRRAGPGVRRIRRGSVLLGLYEGVPLTQRGVHYSAVLPDKITIFQGVIEELGRGSPAEIRAIVHATVLHEVGHHLGMGEQHVRAWERQRRAR